MKLETQKKWSHKGISMVEIILCIVMISSLILGISSPLFQANRMVETTRGLSLAQPIAESLAQRVIQDIEENLSKDGIQEGAQNLTELALLQFPAIEQLQNPKVVSSIQPCEICPRDGKLIQVLISWEGRNEQEREFAYNTLYTPDDLYHQEQLSNQS